VSSVPISGQKGHQSQVRKVTISGQKGHNLRSERSPFSGQKGHQSWVTKIPDLSEFGKVINQMVTNLGSERSEIRKV
jgi:hypothetical protein